MQYKNKKALRDFSPKGTGDKISIAGRFSIIRQMNNPIISTYVIWVRLRWRRFFKFLTKKSPVCEPSASGVNYIQEKIKKNRECEGNEPIVKHDFTVNSINKKNTVPNVTITLDLNVNRPYSEVLKEAQQLLTNAVPDWYQCGLLGYEGEQPNPNEPFQSINLTLSLRFRRLSVDNK